MQEKCHISCSKFVKYQETALVTSLSWYLWKVRSRCWYMQSDTKLAINVCLKINCGSIQRSTLKNNFNSCNHFIHIIFADNHINPICGVGCSTLLSSKHPKLLWKNKNKNFCFSHFAWGVFNTVPPISNRVIL